MSHPEPAGREPADCKVAARRSIEPLRILILRQGFYPADPRVRREAGALVQRGHRVDILCLRASGETARETLAGVRVHRLPMGRRRGGAPRYIFSYGLFFALACPVLTALQLRHRYHLVQVNTMPDLLVWAAWPARWLGAKILLDFHELMPELFASKFTAGMDHPLPRLLARIETAAARFADGCLAVSQPCLDRYRARGAPAERFHIVMNSADPALFPPLEHRRPEPPGSGPLRLVSHGTLVERYGYDLILDALARLRDVAPELHLELEILGAGEQLPALRRQRALLGLADRVRLPGPIPLDRVAERVGRAQIGIVANRSDPFTDLVVPTKLMEYAALGIPAIAPATPAVRAYFDDDMLRLFQPGDADDLARSILELARDPDLRAELAQGMRERFQPRYGWSRMASRYVEIVESLVAAGD